MFDVEEKSVLITSSAFTNLPFAIVDAIAGG
jgi:hypothetical protein